MTMNPEHGTDGSSGAGAHAAGRVTIMMPIYNGELFLREALSSLLAQTYTNFEIVILDNRSVDGTAGICREFAARDTRIRHVVDDRKRNPHEAANRLAEFITGEYCMIACDDDIWEPAYLEETVAELMAHPELGIAYTNARYVDVEGRRGTRSLISGRAVYLRQHSRTANAAHYVLTRRVLPMVFGVFRSEVYLRAIPFDTFDETIADVDNLFVFKVLLDTPVHCVDRILFHYRNKFRWADPDVLKDYPRRIAWFNVWLYDAKHQYRFLCKLLVAASASRLRLPAMLLVNSAACLSFLHYIGPVRIRAGIGRLLTKLGLREGVAQSRDAAADVRHAALVDAQRDTDAK